MTGELLDPGKQTRMIDAFRKRLQDTDVGAPFHHIHQIQHQLAADQTIRIQGDHVFIITSPPTTKVCDISALFSDPDPTMAIKYFSKSIELPAQFQPAGHFIDMLVGIVRVAQNKEMKMPGLTGLGQRFVHHL